MVKAKTIAKKIVTGIVVTQKIQKFDDDILPGASMKIEERCAIHCLYLMLVLEVSFLRNLLKQQS